MDNAEAAEPMLAIEAIDPTDPMDRTEFLLPMLSSELEDRNDHRDWSPVARRSAVGFDMPSSLAYSAG